ncbi:MAG: hypothetical protein H7174_07535 [Flavobacterium sp.]|nr:hypothetical protein [Flavobacterium sp.]
MEQSKSNSNLKAVIVVMALLLVGSLAYIFKLSNDVTLGKNTITTVTSEKDKVLADLSALKTNYDIAISENTTMSDELIAERDKVVKLMDDVKRSNGSVASLSQYKQKYIALDGKMKNLMAQVDDLTKKNTTLTTQIDSTVAVLGETKKANENLLGQNSEMAKSIETASKLTITNLKASAFKLKSSGKQIETDKASRADALKISFTIAENKIAKSGDQTYYVQVIDADNNVLGDKKSIYFGDKLLNYSFVSTVKYNNKSIEVTEMLTGKDFPKGNYFINIFDQKELVNFSTFGLK